MFSIAYIIPYFGKLPNGFDVWLKSCERNPTVDWLLFTDDGGSSSRAYHYPKNVHVTYMTFEQMREKIQACFDFQISLEKPYKLCDFKPTYGEVFKEELKGYDFWGFCDLDLIWGNIRKFMTDDVLSKYKRIGQQGHSMLFRNEAAINCVYRTVLPTVNYQDILSDSASRAFDENGLRMIYSELGIETFYEINFAHLFKYDANFYVGLLPNSEDYKNWRQVFTWKDGCLERKYLHEGEVHSEEFMYVHYWRRPLTWRIESSRSMEELLLYPDVVTNHLPEKLDYKTIKHLGRKKPVQFYMKSLWMNRHKITVEKIKNNIQAAIRTNQRKKTDNYR